MPGFCQAAFRKHVRDEGGPKQGPSGFRRDRRGVSAIEFAMLALPFFLIIFAIVETSVVFIAELTLNQSVDRVTRKLRTGEVQQATMNEADFRKDICDGAVLILDCSNLKIDLKVYSKFSDVPAPSSPVRNGNLDSSAFTYQLPTSSQISALRVYYKWPVVTDLMQAFLSDMGDKTHLLFAGAAFKVEPY